MVNIQSPSYGTTALLYIDDYLWIADQLKPERQGTQLGANEDAFKTENQENDQVFRERLLTAKKLPRICLQQCQSSPTFISLPPLIYLLNIYICMY